MRTGSPVAAALIGAPVSRVRQPLDALVRAHLVEQRAPGRYQLHNLLRAYAVVPLDPPDDITPLAFANSGEADAWSDAERDNLVAATVGRRGRPAADRLATTTSAGPAAVATARTGTSCRCSAAFFRPGDCSGIPSHQDSQGRCTAAARAAGPARCGTAGQGQKLHLRAGQRWAAGQGEGPPERPSDARYGVQRSGRDPPTWMGDLDGVQRTAQERAHGHGLPVGDQVAATIGAPPAGRHQRPGQVVDGTCSKLARPRQSRGSRPCRACPIRPASGAESVPHTHVGRSTSRAIGPGWAGTTSSTRRLASP